MTDAKIKEYIDGYTKAVTILITSETGNIKESIKELKEQVSKQNGSIRELKEWKAGYEGAEKAKEKSSVKSIQIWGLIIAFLVGSGGIALGLFNKKISNYDREYFEWRMQMKQDRQIDSTTRAIYPELKISIDDLK